MKQFAILFLMSAFLTINAQEGSFKEFYKNHKEDAEISFNVPLSLVKSFIDEDDVDEQILKKAKSFKILVYNKRDKNIVNDFKKFSRRNKLKTLIRAKDGKERAELYYREDGEFINEIILVAGSDKEELVFMGLKTQKMTRDELASFVAKHK